MNLFRIWLVVLLAVLVPIRGALAHGFSEAGAAAEVQGQGQVYSQAAPPVQATHHVHDHLHMPMPDDVAQAVAPTVAQAVAESAAQTMHGVDAHPDASLAPVPAGGHVHDHGHPDKCSACDACCAGSAIPSSGHTVLAPGVMSAADFPDVSWVAATFLVDGQERPPRSF